MEKQPITGNEPAQPAGAWGQQTGTGLTIRQDFAAKALPGILAGYTTTTPDPVLVAKLAVKCADALIAELNK
jgi:hypothetical protein